MTVRDRRIWITGACSGIGEALSYELSRRGANLVLSSNRPDALRETRERCPRPDDHLVQPVDLTEPDAIQAAADTVREEAGPVDVLVNNAGIAQRGPAAETETAAVRQVMEVNFFGAVHLTKAVLPAMQDRGHGHIAVVSSVAGKFGAPSLSAYCASKHAVQGWFDSLRAEVHDDGIGVTLACPGFVQTSIASNMVATEGRETVEKVLEKGISPSRCAEAIADAIEQEKPEFYVGGWEVVNVYLKRFVPSLLRYLLQRGYGS